MNKIYLNNTHILLNVYRLFDITKSNIRMCVFYKTLFYFTNVTTVGLIPTPINEYFNLPSLLRQCTFPGIL